MRGYPLVGYLARLLACGFATLLVVGCLAAGPAAPASPAAIGVTITSASGQTVAFDPPEVMVRATGPIAVTFQNVSSQAHNLVFTAGLRAATRTIVEPGTSDQLLLPPLPPAAYPFVCTIHDGMSGTLIVRATSSNADLKSFSMVPAP